MKRDGQTGYDEIGDVLPIDDRFTEVAAKDIQEPVTYCTTSGWSKPSSFLKASIWAWEAS